MENKVYIEELNEWVEDDAEYSEYASEIVDEYCEQLAKEPGMTRPIDEDDCVEYSEYKAEMWTTKACKRIEAEINHYYSIGIKYWPDKDIEIKPMQYREY